MIAKNWRLNEARMIAGRIGARAQNLDTVHQDREMLLEKLLDMVDVAKRPQSKTRPAPHASPQGRNRFKIPTHAIDAIRANKHRHTDKVLALIYGVPESYITKIRQGKERPFN